MQDFDLSNFSPEELLASRVLRIAAGVGSHKADVFSGWLLAGFGAAMALTLANIDSLKSVIPTSSVVSAMNLFVWAALFAFIAKFLAMAVSSSSSVGDAVEKETQEFVSTSVAPGEGLSMVSMAKHLESAYWYPWRWAVRAGFRKALEGDLLFSSRLMIKTYLLQSILVLAQASLHLISILVLLRNVQE